jgi:hypothetical protein
MSVVTIKASRRGPRLGMEVAACFTMWFTRGALSSEGNDRVPCCACTCCADTVLFLPCGCSYQSTFITSMVIAHEPLNLLFCACLDGNLRLYSDKLRLRSCMPWSNGAVRDMVYNFKRNEVCSNTWGHQAWGAGVCMSAWGHQIRWGGTVQC